MYAPFKHVIQYCTFIAHKYTYRMLLRISYGTSTYEKSTYVDEDIWRYLELLIQGVLGLNNSLELRKSFMKI